MTPALADHGRTLLLDAYRLVLCAAVGAATGLIAVAFRGGVAAIERGLSTVTAGLSAAGHPTLAQVVFLATPGLGGLVVGFLVYRVVKLRAGHGVPAVITAAAADRPMTDWRMGFKAGSAVITIGSGGSVGPEGPIVELGAVVGSYAWKLFRLPGQWVRIMMGCGAAAGIAAIFNVPLGGVIFVLDVVLRDYSLRSLVPLMVASMSASTVTNYAGEPAIRLPEYSLRGDELLYAPLLGVAAAIVSTLFIRANFVAADVFRRAPVAAWIRPALGGLLVGLIGLATPWVRGEGYDAVDAMVRGSFDATALVVPFLWIALARIVATAATLGSGGTGGAFAPSLVIGAALGLATGGGLSAYLSSARVDPTAFALAGMAGLLAGVFQAPLSGVVIAFNLSRWNPQLLLPLMCVAMISAWLTQHLARASIYELALLRDGVDLAASRSLQNILAGRGIEGIVRRPVEMLAYDATLGQVIDTVSRTHQTIFPVLGGDARVAGVLKLSALRTMIRDTQLGEAMIAADLLEPLDAFVLTTDSLAAAWSAFAKTTDEELLVLNGVADGPGVERIVGLVRRSDLVSHVKW